MADAYLDIETTGLSLAYDAMTVLGIHVVDGDECRLVQFVGDAITRRELLWTLNGVHVLYTYNGSRFDLPFIRKSLGVDLASALSHRDLMHACWKCNLKGGLKVVERQLGIQREVAGIDGRRAVTLWRRYQNHGDTQALDLLLRYNREDVTNLRILRERLHVILRSRQP